MKSKQLQATEGTEITEMVVVARLFSVTSESSVAEFGF
jgi:hypothetical protein